MHLPSKSVYKILTEKNINELFHANSVLTACQFLREGALLSRGTIEHLGYNQTDQDSDDIDQKYSIWFDIFADTVDIHARAKKCNVYGPVLFVFDTDLIINNNTGRIWVTKSNPIEWAYKSEDERWFKNRNDLSQNLVKGRFEQMIVFRHCGGRLPFKGHLKKIILDDPDRKIRRVDFYSLAVGAIQLAMEIGNVNVQIERRKCQPYCECTNQYENNKKFLLKMFVPKSLSQSTR